MKKVLAIFSCLALVCAISLGVTGCTDSGKKTTPAKTTTGEKTTAPTTTPAKTTP